MRAPPPLMPIDPVNDEQLIRHYEQFIAPRILPASSHIHQFGQQDPIVTESRGFMPVRTQTSLLHVSDKIYHVKLDY